jgi:hypothetical protein
MLTPEDVLPPNGRSFVVSLQQFEGETEAASQPRQSTSNPAGNSKWASGNKTHLHSRGCPFCGKQHISVQYFGHNHTCLNCRKYLKTEDGRKVRIVLGKDDEVHAYSRAEGEAMETEVDNQDLYIFDVRCYASFGDETELIVLPYDIS